MWTQQRVQNSTFYIRAIYSGAYTLLGVSNFLTTQVMNTPTQQLCMGRTHYSNCHVIMECHNSVLGLSAVIMKSRTTTNSYEPLQLCQQKWNWKQATIRQCNSITRRTTVHRKLRRLGEGGKGSLTNYQGGAWVSLHTLWRCHTLVWALITKHHWIED